MIGSLFLSIIFHSFIILVFLFGSDFLGLKKKIKLTDIPIEVVEIAKKSEAVSKKIEKKKEPIKKKTEYKPPKIIEKPKPPEFAKIENKKTSEKQPQKVKKEDLKKEKKVDRLSSILNTIEKIKKNQDKEDIVKDKTVESKIPDFTGEKLTISEIDIIRRQFIPCWTVPAGIKDVSKISVSVKLKLDPDGNVIGSKLSRDYGSKSRSYKSVAESVLRAVKHPACKKIQVPKKKYEMWKNITLNFDLSDID